MTMERRRLKLLPEVLPDPTASRGPGSPRQRTVEHMRRLLTASVAATAVLGCSKEDQVAIRPEDPSKMKKSKADPEPTTTTTTSPTVTSTTPTTSPTPTYAVVDPLPPPAACAGLASTIKATASWKSADGGSFLELKLPKPGRADAKYGKTPTTTPVYGGKLLSIVEAGGAVTVQVVPDAGSKDVYVYIEASCSTGTERVYASMAFTSVGAPISVVLSDVF